MNTQRISSRSWDRPSLTRNAEQFSGRPLMSIFLIVVVFLCLASALVWSFFAEVVEVAVGEGKVIPARKVQLVQNLEGGIIKNINAAEGDIVSTGDVLVVIDPTASDAALGEREEHIASLIAGREWISAFLEDRVPSFPDDFSVRHASLVERALVQYRAKKDEVSAAVAALEQQEKQKLSEMKSVRVRLENARPQYEIATEQLSMFENLKKQNAASRADVLNAKTRVLELRTQMDDLINQEPIIKASIEEISARKNEVEARLQAELVERLNEVSVKINASEQAVIADRDRIERTRVKSPVDGVVKILHTNTVGQIVKPGENIVEIVPLDENLLIETRIKPNDIAFIYPDQKAVIKITAYDSSVFGHLEGVVRQISADALADENGTPFYRIQVEADAGHLLRHGQKFPVIPGMVAQVDIVTGEKTVLEYLTKPVHRMATTAFRER